MILSDQAFNELLPGYLHDSTKGRIKSALSQFWSDGNINYDGFYNQFPAEHLMQGDILHSVPCYIWDDHSGELISGFNSAMLISNSCDVSIDNIRSINRKDILFAPIIPLQEYIADLELENLSSANITTFLTGLKKQEYSNLLYLPPNPLNQKEYIVRLDRLYWIPSKLVTAIVEN